MSTQTLEAPPAPKMPFPHHVKAEDRARLRVTSAVQIGEGGAFSRRGEWGVTMFNALGFAFATAYGPTKSTAEKRAAEICAKFNV